MLTFLNPANNVTYTYEASGFAPAYPEHPGVVWIGLDGSRRIEALSAPAEPHAIAAPANGHWLAVVRRS